MATDKRVFEALSLEDVRLFLAGRGFVVIAEDSKRADVWGMATGEGDLELLVPRTEAVRDYGIRLAEVFTTISTRMSQRVEELLREVSGIGSDIVRLRRASFNAAEDTIRLRDGAALHTSALDMMSAAACTAVSPRAVLPTRRPPQALDYMRRIELGQSERGSYVISLVSRVAPQLTPGAPGLLEFLDEPFPRKVTSTLARAVRAATAAVEASNRDGGYSAFEEVVGAGLSANLCDALSRLVLSEGDSAPIELRLSWAKSRPVSPDVQSRFFLEPTQGEVLQGAAEFLRAKEPQHRVLLVGSVTDLHREVRELDGQVSVTVLLDGKSRKLRLALEAAEYQIAHAAHGSKVPVMFRADIRKEGRTWLAEGIAEFRAIDS